MTQLDIGITGAKRQSWRDANPRALLQRIFNENRKADETELRQKFWKEVGDDEDLLRAMGEYWLDHNVRSLMNGVMPGPRHITKSSYKQSMQHTERLERAKEQLQKRVEAEALKLLDLIMPNGKPLGQCTGEECRKLGGWLIKIATRVPPKTKVADRLSEQQVRTIFQSK